jgi:hypothetical protein
MSAPRQNSNYLGYSGTQLKQETTSHSATGSSTTTGTIDLQQQRGPVTSISILVADSTIANVDGCTMSLGANSSNFAVDFPLLAYSPLMAGSIYRIPCHIEGGGRITFSVVNDQGTAIVVYITLHYNNS